VRVASNTSLAGQITAAGLTAVELGERSAPPAPITDEELTAFGDALAFEADSDFDRLFRATRYYMAAAYKRYHPDERGRQELVDNLVRGRRQLAAGPGGLGPGVPGRLGRGRESGAASARMMWGPDYTAWLRGRLLERWNDGLSPETDPLAALLAPVWARFRARLLRGHAVRRLHHRPAARAAAPARRAAAPDPDALGALHRRGVGAGVAFRSRRYGLGSA